MENLCDVMLMTHLGDFEVLLYHCQFLRLYWQNYFTHRSPRHKKIKLSDILSFFVNFDLDKGGASVPFAPSLVAPLSAVLCC